MITWRNIGFILVVWCTFLVGSGCTSQRISYTPAIREYREILRSIKQREVICSPPRAKYRMTVDALKFTNTEESPMMFIMPRDCQNYPIWIQNMVVNQAMVKDLISGRILFNACTFDGLRLETASFTYVRFKYCSFKNASFKGTTLQEVNFHDCDLTGAYFDPDIIDGPTKSSILNGRNILEADVEWFIRMRGHDVNALLDDDDVD